jgi:glycosyltransferase involved in cell wall biosynthesis
MNKKEIYLTAFEAKPNVGTEAGLAWNWAQAYSKQGLSPVVLTNTIQSPDEKAQWDLAGIKLVTLGPSRNSTAPEGIASMIRLSFEFRSWRKSCEEFFDSLSLDSRGIAHHVSWGSARLRPPLPARNSHLICIVGPLGGGHLPVLQGLNWRTRLTEILRLGTFLLSFLNRPSIGIGRQKPSIVLFTNRQTKAFLRLKGFKNLYPMFADGISKITPAKYSTLEDKTQEGHVLLWAGRLVPTKRPDLAVLLAAELQLRGHRTTLQMAGSGPEMQKVVDLAKELNVNAVFYGKVPWSEMGIRYDSAFVFLFHSMRDSSSPGILEAASRGIPSVGLRVSGAGDFVPHEVFLGREKFVSDVDFVRHNSEIVESLIKDTSKYQFHCDQSILFAGTQTWDTKVQTVLRLLGRV